jgi:carboxypeptidase Q
LNKNKIKYILPYFLKVEILFFYLIPSIMYAQSELNYKVVNAIKTESYDNSQAYEMLNEITTLFGPRLSGTENYMDAATWAKDELESLGLDNVHFESYSDNFRNWSAKSFSIELLKPRYSKINTIPYAWVNQTKGVIKGVPVLVDHNNLEELKKYSGKLRGKILLNPNVGNRDDVRTGPFTDEILAAAANHNKPNNPDGLDNSGLEPFTESLKRKISDKKETDVIQLLLLKEKVAAVITGSSSSPGIIYARQLPYHKQRDLKPVPHFVIGKEDHQLIVGMIEKGLNPDLKLHLKVDFKDVSENHVNIFGEIPGIDEKLKDQIVLIGGHYDSYHSGTGAADNGQGCATLMEVMRILKKIDIKPRRTIRIALWGGEEQGLNGSMHYIKNYVGDVVTGAKGEEHSKISAYFNHDNNGHNIRGIFMQGNPELRPIFEDYLSPFHSVGAKTVSVENACCTDHVPFDALNIPAFEWIQDPMHYFTHQIHTNLDVLDLVTESSLKHNAAIIATFVYHTAMRDELLPRKK